MEFITLKIYKWNKTYFEFIKNDMRNNEKQETALTRINFDDKVKRVYFFRNDEYFFN